MFTYIHLQALTFSTQNCALHDDGQLELSLLVLRHLGSKPQGTFSMSTNKTQRSGSPLQAVLMDNGQKRTQMPWPIQYFKQPSNFQKNAFYWGDSPYGLLTDIKCLLPSVLVYSASGSYEMIHPGTSWALHCQRVSRPWSCARAQCNMTGKCEAQAQKNCDVNTVDFACLKSSPKFIKKSKFFAKTWAPRVGWRLSCFQRKQPKAQDNFWGGLPRWCNTWRLLLFFLCDCDVNKRCIAVYRE